MATGNLKIMELTWGNLTDLATPQWKNSPIQSPYWSRKWEYEFILSRAVVHNEQIVADMGSGSMNPLPVYLDKTYSNLKIYAVDLNPSPFPSTKQIATLQEDLTKTSIPLDSVDRVLCVSVLEHMAKCNWIPAMQEFKRILRPGGKIVMTVDVEDKQGSMWNFRRPELEWFIKNVDPNAVIPPIPPDILTSDTGTLPGERDLHLTVLGVVLEVH